MSEIKVDKISGKTSANAVTVTSEGGSTTTNLQQGLAKAWINFNGTGTPAARDSFNCSIQTDEGTGDYSLSFTSAFNDANGSFVFGCLTNSGSGDVRGVNNVPPTTTSIRIYGLNGSQSALQDLDYIWMQVDGDLA